MAILTTVFSLFTIQILILVTSTEADPQIEVHPSEISLGTSSSLDINCSFSSTDHPEMAAVVSLVLSKANSSGQNFQDLAAITQFSPDSVTILTTEKVSATGAHSQTGESFLQLTWDYPTATQAGVYQCVARGLDILGNHVEVVNSSTVTVAQADLNDIFEKLKQMELREMNMEKHIEALEHNKSQMSSYITNLEKTGTVMDKNIQDLQNNNSQMSSYITELQRFQAMTLIGTFENHDYYISKEWYGEISNVLRVCQYYRGYLAEIDNENEFNAIKSFLSTTSGFSIAMIAGTDKASDGHWIFQSNNEPLPFTSWFTAGASVDPTSNCLGLPRYHSWNMADYPCKYDPPHNGIRFTCEIPRV